MEESSVELPIVTDPDHHHKMSVREVLRNRPFRFLWFSQILSQVAGHILNFVLVIIVYNTTGSNALVSILVALISIPPILFSSLAGVYADNFNRKHILLLSNLTRCLVGVGLLVFGHVSVLLIGLAFVISTISQFFGPAESSSIASLVHRRGYFSANSLFVFTTYTSFLVGYSLAGPILKHFGETNTSFLLIVLFGLAAVMNMLLPPIRDHLDHIKGASIYQRAFGSLRKDLKEGMSFIRHNHFLLLILLLVSAIFSFERAIISLLPDLAKNVFFYSLDEISYYIITPAGLGAFAGAVIANVLKHRVDKTKIIIAGMLIAGVALMLFPLYQSVDALVVSHVDLVLFVALLAFLSGFGDVFIIIAAQTLIHENTTTHTRGRVFGSLITVMNAVGLPLILLVGFLANRFPIVDIIFSIGLVITCMIVASLILFRQVYAEAAAE